jgi:hypothetical protein
VREYVLRQPTAVTVIVRSMRVPDFVTRHPGLVTEPPPAAISGWQIDFTWYGLPKSWRALQADDPAISAVTGRSIVFADSELLARFPCQNIVRSQAGAHVPGPKLVDVLDLLFAGR